jgi:hypothetical protein
MFYRLKNWLNYTAFSYRTRAISQSPPLACDPAAGCEVHTMLGRRDLPLYLVAIKSLLRFYRSVGVVVHSDGTLDARAEAALRHHVPGCRLITPGPADGRAREALAGRPLLARYRALDASYRRLIDTELHSAAPKRIILDADILVLRRPDEMIDWIEQGETPFLMGQPPGGGPGTPAPGRRHVQDLFRDKLDELGKALGFPSVFLAGSTSACYGCSRELSLDVLERVIGRAEALGVPMQRWGGEQATVVYLLSLAGPRHLDVNRYINYDPRYAATVADMVLVHFYGTHRFHQNLYPRLAAKVAAGLARTPAADAPVGALPAATQHPANRS